MTDLPESAGQLPELTADELARYARHLTLPEVGMEGQRKLKAARVLCVGAGGLGSPLAFYLAAAGIGTLGLVDFDVVDASNLQRQIIHSTKDIGRKKLDSAAEKLAALNPALNIVKHETMLTSANALEILKDYDIVADGTDNFPTRYLVNDACVLLGKPNVYGSIFRFEGQASVFATRAGPLLPLPLSRAAAARPGAQLRRGRGAGHSSRPGRRHPGHRGHQADPGPGRAADRPAAAGGLAGHALPRAQAAQESRLPGLRSTPHRHPSHRLPAVLRNPIRREATTGESLINGIPQTHRAATQAAASTPASEVYLLDVREPYEYQIANIGGKLIPLNDVPQRLAEVDRDREVVVHCKSGGRSQAAAEFLQQAGYPRVANLTGGILAWSRPDRPHGAEVLTETN